MNVSNLTKPQIILCLISFGKNTLNGFFETGYFKDKKSISNCIYQLHKNGYIVKCNGKWHMTRDGEAYIFSVLHAAHVQENASTNDGEANKLISIINKLNDEIAQLRADNERLAAENENLHSKIDELEPEDEGELAENDEVARYAAQVQAFAEIAGIFSNIASSIASRA